MLLLQDFCLFFGLGAFSSREINLFKLRLDMYSPRSNRLYSPRKVTVSGKTWCLILRELWCASGCNPAFVNLCSSNHVCPNVPLSPNWVWPKQSLPYYCLRLSSQLWHGVSSCATNARGRDTGVNLKAISKSWLSRSGGAPKGQLIRLVQTYVHVSHLTPPYTWNLLLQCWRGRPKLFVKSRNARPYLE